MWGLGKMTKTVSDVTVGTVIVLWHAALADREKRASLAHAHEDADDVPEHQRDRREQRERSRHV